MTSNANGLSTPLLARHLETFLGFGNPTASVWFIGPEQGGGHDLNEIDRRVTAWKHLGMDSHVDLRQFHRLIGIDRWFHPNPKIQSTWGKLIRCYLALSGKPIYTESVRSFQADGFGDLRGNVAMIELMPLPSRSMRHWIFDSITEIPYLESRERYLKTLMPQRIKTVREAVAHARPKAVILYGTAYLAHWEAITGQPIRRNGAGFGIKCIGATQYAITPHPTAHGVTNDQFERLGQALADGGDDNDPPERTWQ